MDDNIVKKLKSSLDTSLIDKGVSSDEDLRPYLITNSKKDNSKVINYIVREFEDCSEFCLSVAFITNSGLNLILNSLRDLERRGIKGKILTTNYLNFNEPSALRRLLKFSNVEVRMYDSGNFHSKGYIFKKKDHYDLIIGSSNLTQEALTKNEEWNLRITSMEEGELANFTLSEFDFVWERSNILTTEWIDDYEEYYDRNKQYSTQNIEVTKYENEIVPNDMQKEALANLKELRIHEKDKALLISATGTGKTFLSAFDVREFNPRKMLFVVHREQIAKAAMRSFKEIFGDSKSMGILSGTHHDTDKDFVFATIQTLCKDSTLDSLSKHEFNYIIIDEVHRAGAESYQKILKHFMPDFLLGMTATPERTDGYNIYKIFDYNIAYEIRLQRALEEDMLCPFHYFGVSEIHIDDELLGDDCNFSVLVSEERVRNIIEKLEFYGHSGKKARGLIFCSRNDESAELSKMFNERGYKTIALSGENTQDEREDAVRRLESDGDDHIDYIFTVDIFNEGVDIPSINQIIMLRPTESAIIFVQQLGRGLRKMKFKDYVVVLDFIGNYQKNFLIPIALSGDRTFKKDSIRRYVMEGTSAIPGASTVMFEDIVKDRIFESINNTSFTTLKLLKAEYNDLKVKLGRIPNLVDFYKYGAIDPQLIIENSDTYYHFLHRVEQDYKVKLKLTQENIVKFISKELLNAKRPHELVILRELLSGAFVSKETISEKLRDEFGIVNDEESIESALNILSGGFITEAATRRYNGVKLVTVMNVAIKKSQMLVENLSGGILPILNDMVEYGFMEYKEKYSKRYKNLNLSLYQKYSRKDVCRLLNWKNNEESTVYGYRIKDKTCPIFVTYKKGQNIADSVRYEDVFVNRNTFSWMTKNNRNMNSDDVVAIKNYLSNGLRMHLFIKKDDDEGADFYYFGEVYPVRFESRTISNDVGKNLPIVNVTYEMEHPVREDLYDYMTK